MTVKANATISVTIELDDAWPDDVTAKQVFDQAKNSAKFVIERIFEAAASGQLEINGMKQRIRGRINSIDVNMVLAGEPKNGR